MKKMITTMILALKEVEGMIDKAREAVERSENLSAADSENLSAADLLIGALLAADRSADYLARAIQLNGSGNKVDAAYYCKKAKIMADMAYKHAELAIKEAALAEKAIYDAAKAAKGGGKCSKCSN